MVRIGTQLGLEHTTIASLRKAWCRVDSLGVDTMWTWDHFFPIHGSPDGSHFECWSVLAAMAVTTQRVDFGPLVSCSAFRNPNLLAGMARTIDHLSDGRFILGLGAGWFQRDFDEYGYPYPSPGTRLRDLERTVRVVRHRWGNDKPHPRRRIPVLIGSGGPRVGLPIVARHADIWNWFGPPSEFGRCSSALDDWCERIGRRPSTIERSVTIYDPAELALLDDYVAAGAQHLILGIQDPWNWDAAERLVLWAADHRPDGYIPRSTQVTAG